MRTALFSAIILLTACDQGPEDAQDAGEMTETDEGDGDDDGDGDSESDGESGDSDAEGGSGDGDGDGEGDTGGDGDGDGDGCDADAAMACETTALNPFACWENEACADEPDGCGLVICKSTCSAQAYGEESECWGTCKYELDWQDRYQELVCKQMCELAAIGCAEEAVMFGCEISIESCVDTLGACLIDCEG